MTKAHRTGLIAFGAIFVVLFAWIAVAEGLGNDLVFLATVEAEFLDLCEHHFARLEAILAGIAFRNTILRRRDHPGFLVHQLDQKNVVTPRHLKIVEVMPRSYF